MTDRIDTALSALRTALPEANLAGLERGVWAQIDRQKADAFRGRGLQVQFAATCAALLVGLLVSQFVGTVARPLMSEVAVLSDDSFLSSTLGS